MSITLQTINIGSAPEDGTGDTARDAFDKVNDNFTALSTAVGGAQYLFPGTNVIQLANAENVGGNVLLYDTDHATKADDIEFRADSTVVGEYDSSQNTWDFQGKTVTAGRFSTSGGAHTFLAGASDAVLEVGGSGGSTLSATVQFRGASASNAHDIVFFANSNEVGRWDESASLWDYSGQDIAAHTLRVDNADTVAGLPGSPVVGQIARVTDANSPSVGSTVTGGGAAAALVWYNGSNWTVIGV